MKDVKNYLLKYKIMDSIEKLKSINLTEHIQKYLWQGKNELLWTRFHSSPEDKTASLLVYKDNLKWYNDFSWRLKWWSIIDFQMNYFNLSKSEAIKQLCEMYSISDDNKKIFKKTPKRYELVERFEDFRFKNINSQFRNFLTIRGFNFELLKEFEDWINDICKEIWFCEWQFVDTNIFKDVLIFPCLNAKKEIVWAKLRRCDWEKILNWDNYVKSIAVSKPKDYTWIQKFSTGLLFDEIWSEYVLIVEWEIDYLILKILWFKSVIWNLWWVATNTDKIQQLVKNVDKIVCMYDNDEAWLNGTYSLQEKIWRPIRKINYPKIEWIEKYDINDLFKMWYRKNDFNKLILDSNLLQEISQDNPEDNLQETTQKLFQDRFFYNDTKTEYFDIKDFSFKTPNTLARHLYMKLKDLEDLRKNKKIPVYEWICYLDWWINWYYNLLDKSKISHPSNNPIIHDDIKLLISNICNYDETNIEWLEKAILYKYTHLNDVLIPAVVFHWVWGTWKWLFIKLLSEIFGENNTQSWLTQENIDSQFSAYSWQKLIVEFKELSVDWTAKGKKNMNKLKTFIMEEKIMIRKMRQDPISTENIAWFIMSSNDSKPLLLDSADSWNRRFTIIKTWWFIWLEIWGRIAKAIKNKNNISNFLAYLFNKFPNIKEETCILPLENEDKKDLEFLSESVANLFFQWVEKNYPNINKITNQEKEYLLESYRIEIWETEWTDERYKIQFFNSNLSIKYKPCVLRIRDKTLRWYKINKEVNGSWEFPENFFIVNNKPKWIL